MFKSLLATIGLLVAVTVATNAAEASFTAELVFPLHAQHNHAPGIVEFPNGDLLVSWYRGAGERRADDVAVFGARLQKGSDKWSKDFLLADWPGFPDCNTCMMIDRKERLWLFWPTILANTWESCLTNFKVSSDYSQDGPPQWERAGMILLKPEDFQDEALQVLTGEVRAVAERSLPCGDQRDSRATRQ